MGPDLLSLWIVLWKNFFFDNPPSIALFTNLDLCNWSCGEDVHLESTLFLGASETIVTSHPKHQ